MSGSFVLRSGVGTQMLMVSSSRRSAEVGRRAKLAGLPSAATSAVDTSGMYEWPALIASIFRVSRSMPMAWKPAARELDRERQSDVAEADDADARLPRVDTFEKRGVCLGHFRKYCRATRETSVRR